MTDMFQYENIPYSNNKTGNIPLINQRAHDTMIGKLLQGMDEVEHSTYIEVKYDYQLAHIDRDINTTYDNGHCSPCKESGLV